MTGGNTLPDNLDPGDAQNRTIADDDAGFVTRCRRGETEAFSVLVRRHQKKMLNIAYRMIGDYDESCDVVQEAFLSAYRAIGKFRGDARFSTWLIGIVLNHSRSHMAKKVARSRHEAGSLDDHVKPETGSSLNEPRSQAGSILEQIERRELEAKVQECIGLLDGEARDVLVLRDIQGFSYEEIGVMLKLPEGTVKSRLFRARNALKDSLSRVLGDLI
ncbi:MAG TPA: RNA polymerase subunit sigma-24 [Syntrophus sp. (in: bacteria)]|nr:RNA polymerase subunit sigma-24 [Syntrophus sp. (in: bacteria)]